MPWIPVPSPLIVPEQVVGVLSSSLSPDLLCGLFFWKEDNTVGLLIIYSPSESNSTSRPFFTHLTIRQRSHHQEVLGRRDTTSDLVCWVLGVLSVGGAGAASLDGLLRNRPVR